jgi:hypothetical protein
LNRREQKIRRREEEKKRRREEEKKRRREEQKNRSDGHITSPRATQVLTALNAH